MLSYLIVRELKRAWAALDLTVEEGLDSLKRICSTRIKLKGGGTCLRVPNPDHVNLSLLSALDIQLPPALPESSVKVATKRKLPNRRKV